MGIGLRSCPPPEIILIFAELSNSVGITRLVPMCFVNYYSFIPGGHGQDDI
jgi:hypothetical protein